MRLDRLIADALGCGRRRARELVRGGRVSVDGRPAAASSRPPRGALVVVETTPSHDDAREALPVEVLWEGRGLLALAKPAGLHSQRGREHGSVADFLAARDPTSVAFGDDARECGLVHRLDRDTSGVLLAATDARSYRRTRRAFAAGEVIKDYLALVAGEVRSGFTVDVPLARRRTRVVRARRGDRPLAARTEVVPVERGAGWSLVAVSMRSGVTHQVRAHLAMAGHAVIGDLKYGCLPAPSATRSGQLLHAARVRWADTVDVSAEAPADFRTAHRRLAG